MSNVSWAREVKGNLQYWKLVHHRTRSNAAFRIALSHLQHQLHPVRLDFREYHVLSSMHVG